ncbi:uncharacterized protein LOC129794725 [Lutzomyia longipalpis]|uniref:uncharacterized protein LOC129794725 n=1 Tax=Lutzomyia longipalpis TaxID=7200 RepID=UPI00248358A2|nr:uncharacterized protein LOC129794725 [Lutzomyia longipalpis]
MLKKVLFALFLGANVLCVLTEEICLKSKNEGNSTVCLNPARPVSSSDLDQFTIMCKLSRGQFPFQPRGARDGPSPRMDRTKDGAPHIGFADSKFEYRYRFDFDLSVDCDDGIKHIASDMFWMSNPEPSMQYQKLIAREFNVNDKERNNTCLGFVVNMDEKMEFKPVYRDDLFNIPKEPYAYEYLVVRAPRSIEYNVTGVSESTQETSVVPADMGYFSYYNPSEYTQIIEVFLDNKYYVRYSFDPISYSRVYKSTTFYSINEDDRTIPGTSSYDINQKVPFNISIPAFTSLTARIVGKSVDVTSTIKAIQKSVYSDDLASEPIEVQGKKYETFLTDFHLEDAQMHHTSEVLVVNYTTIYVALLCIGVVIVASILVFTVRMVIRRIKGTAPVARNEVPYQTLQANS